jgi:hypothetical protein
VYDLSSMSNRLLVACGVIAAAAVGIWLKIKRPGSAEFVMDGDNGIEPGANLPQLSSVSIDDDEAAEIISRARPALDRAAKLL